MTDELALKEFESLCEINEHYGNGNNVELFQTAIEALKKQTPQKPKVIKYVDGSSIESDCPLCNKRICAYFANDNKYFRWQMPYCCDCGQKIDWGEENRNEQYR